MSSSTFGRSIQLFYWMSFLFFLMVLAVGLPYYLLPVADRPHSDMHTALKPGGTWGHGLGVIGSAMILLLLTYSLRKKHRLGIRWGRLNRWLNVHIFLGIVGPLLITLHTALKFHGIVSISYYAMVAVALSGFFGRYVYMQIPRDTRGTAMNLSQIDAKEREVGETLRRDFNLSPVVLARLNALYKARSGKHRSGLLALLVTVGDDLTMPFRTYRLRRYLRGREAKLSGPVISRIVGLAKKRAVLQRRLLLFNTMRGVFHLWHVIHLPFAYIMIVIMFLHIIVTVTFGYRWIF
jgi:hypothetical protein